MLTTVTAEVTGNTKADMKWANYWDAVVKKYKVVVEGWPSRIPFALLTQACSGVSDTEALLKSWMNGTTYWRQLDDDEFIKEEKTCDTHIASGEIPACCLHKACEDKGKKWSAKGKGPATSKRAKGVISKELIEDDLDKENDTDEGDTDVNSHPPKSNATQQASSSITQTTGTTLWIIYSLIANATAEQTLLPLITMQTAGPVHANTDVGLGWNGMFLFVAHCHVNYTDMLHFRMIQHAVSGHFVFD